VLASSSGGNCSVLKVVGPRGHRWITLLDAGLSPRRTRLLLAQRGVDLGTIDDVILTHLDRDHWHPAWVAGRHWNATVRFHQRHLPRARSRAIIPRKYETFEGTFKPIPGVRVVPQLAAHDALGTSVFRVEIQGAGSLGFATDLGRITDATVEHLAGVDVLAIESNYCPELQRRSGRPAFLQQRITGGSGHLSNHEAADAIARIAPTRAVVMLHLSRQCNRPSLVSELHASAMQEVWIASATDPTRWIEVRRADPAPGSSVGNLANHARAAPSQPLLFGHVASDRP